MPRVRVHALSHVEKGERHPSERFIFYKNGFAKTKTKAKKQTQRVCHERSPPRSLVSSGACAVWPRLGLGLGIRLGLASGEQRRLRVVAEAGQVSAEAVRLEEAQHRIGQLRA